MHFTKWTLFLFGFWGTEETGNISKCLRGKHFSSERGDPHGRVFCYEPNMTGGVRLSQGTPNSYPHLVDETEVVGQTNKLNYVT